MAPYPAECKLFLTYQDLPRQKEGQIRTGPGSLGMVKFTPCFPGEILACSSPYSLALTWPIIQIPGQPDASVAWRNSVSREH